MILKNVKVENFLSVSGKSEFPVDPNVTVMLGANDHGKSNLLRALQCLNEDTPIKPDDVNWDAKSCKLDFTFALKPKEQQQLRALLKVRTEAREKEIAEKSAVANAEHAAAMEEFKTAKLAAEQLRKTTEATQPVTVTVNIGSTTLRVPPSTPSTTAVAMPKPPILPAPAIKADHAFLKSILDAESKEIVLSRHGVGAELLLNSQPLSQLPNDISDLILSLVPRVEFFDAVSGGIQDSVTAEEIKLPTSEFLQGVFFYAGLDPLDSDKLFVHNDETDKTLETASKILDRELRKLWGQGVDLNLHFQLKHRGSSIELLADDPSVKIRKTRMSKRSAGVTQFFRLSMILQARKKKNPSNAYIYIFDEPGVFLHPKGQKDLLQVFELLSEVTQIIYATHSLFMLNQNFPERHRLISKDANGTKVDSKPYRANWKYAVDALGVRLTSNILFSPAVLLVEGDSDPIYIYELFRVLNRTGKIDADANLLGVMSYSDLQNLRFLIQTFKLGNDDCTMAVLCDGDSQGRQYKSQIQPLTEKVGSKLFLLNDDLTIEDYCLFPALFVQAVEMTIRSALEATDQAIPTDLKKSIDNLSNDKAPNVASGKAARENTIQKFERVCEGLVGEKCSKVALARNYAFLCREMTNLEAQDANKLNLAVNLCTQISTALKLPSVRAKAKVQE